MKFKNKALLRLGFVFALGLACFQFGGRNASAAAPTWTSASITNMTADGYDVYIYGVVGAINVQFPTWSNASGQADIIWLSGTNQGSGTWFCHVSRNSFANAVGGYSTHVYIVDSTGLQNYAVSFMYDFSSGWGYTQTKLNTSSTFPITDVYPVSTSNKTGSVSVPDSVWDGWRACPVTSLKAYAFQSCNGLTSLTFGDSITTIGWLFIDATTTVTNIDVGSNNTVYKSIDGILFNKNATTILKYPPSRAGTTYDIPSSVTRVHDYCFYGSVNLTNITVDDNITSIGEAGFHSCSKLTSVTLGKSLTSIEHASFALTPLVKVVIPDSMVSIDRSVFYGCNKLTDVLVPASVTQIDDYAFYGCTSLNNLRIYGSTCSIFDSIASLNVTRICGFAGSTAQAYATKWSIPFSVLPEYDNEFISDTIPSTMVAGKTYTVSITMRNLCKYVWSEAGKFRLGYCSVSNGFNGLIVSQALKGDKVVKIGSKHVYTFDITAPETVGTYSLEWSGLRECICWFGPKLTKSITVTSNPSEIKTWGYTLVSGKATDVYPIKDSVKIGSVVIPNTIDGYPVTSIRDSAFASCTGITAVTFPSSLTRLEEHAFFLCTGLTKVVIPYNVNYIGEFAFYNCSGVSDTYIFNKNCVISDSDITIHLGNIHAAAGSTAQTYATTYGKSFIALPTHDAEILSMDVPTTMIQGKGYSFDVTVRNLGSLTWDSANKFRIGMTSTNTNFTEQRTIVGASPVLPGDSYTFHVSLSAPVTLEEYPFSWRMLQDNVAWFGETISRTVTVLKTEPVSVQSIDTSAVKTQYMAGESIDMTGLKITVLYDNDTTKTVTSQFILRSSSLVVSDQASYNVKWTEMGWPLALWFDVPIAVLGASYTIPATLPINTNGTLACTLTGAVNKSITINVKLSSLSVLTRTAGTASSVPLKCYYGAATPTTEWVVGSTVPYTFTTIGTKSNLIKFTPVTAPTKAGNYTANAIFGFTIVK